MRLNSGDILLPKIMQAALMEVCTEWQFSMHSHAGAWERGNSSSRQGHLKQQIAKVNQDLRGEIIALRKDMDKRFEAMQQQMNNRFEQVDRRFEGMQQRLDAFMKWSLTTTITVGAVIIAVLRLIPPLGNL